MSKPATESRNPRGSGFDTYRPVARTRHDGDIDKLGRLKALSWLPASELESLAERLTFADFRRSQVILREAEFASGVHILIRGIACITCQNGHGERVTIALLPPGPIPELPSLPHSRFDFRCEAYCDCRVGSLARSGLNGVTVGSPELIEEIHQNDLQQWYRLLMRGALFLNLSLHDRIAITLLELARDFGVKESRGALLRVFFSHRLIANLVGASRPRVTEYLEQLEREHLVVRKDRQMIVRVDEIEKAIAISPTEDRTTLVRGFKQDTEQSGAGSAHLHESAPGRAAPDAA